MITKDSDLDEQTQNLSSNRYFGDVLEVHMSRRQVIKGGLGAATASMFGLPLAGCLNGSDSMAATTRPMLSFQSIPISSDDVVHVPEGYTAKVLYAWGDPVSDGPDFSDDAQNSAADQAVQAGMHHDGMHYFSLPYDSDASDHGLLVMNHEYVDDALIHIDGGYNDSPGTYSAEKANKEINSHGVSVIEIRNTDNGWEVVRPSVYGRRITGNTPMTLSGPVAGTDYVKTNADPTGINVLGTLNNCANGYTPWGTYLACEENFHQYFGSASKTSPKNNNLNNYSRYGVGASSSYGWQTQVDRFNLDVEPNEPNRFGWIVEIDPYDPASKPVKHTAMGRFRHESAALSIAGDGRIVFYSGDDSRFEYIYKFVSARAYNANDRAANYGLLSEGTLYVAKFNDDGTGKWMPLIYGQGPLTNSNGFVSQADVLVNTRAAADALEATPMDRPEWIAVHPETKEVYATLTNNTRRTEAQVDASNPRAPNAMGHIIRWREADPADTAFEWDIYVLAGSPELADAANKGNINGDVYANPDGLWFDHNKLLWIQTDISGSAQLKGDFAAFGNNQMLASNISTGETRRFLTGPLGCEVTGISAPANMKTLFVNIQHPGEGASPGNPTAVSSWPNGSRPRSATLAITKDDGGVIGS